MKNKKLIILCGIPASGKSTWAESYQKTRSNVKWVSRDKIRYAMLDANDKYFAKEEYVYRKFIDTIVFGLYKYDVVIADATHLNKWSRKKLIDSVNATIKYFEYNIKYDLIGINFNVSLEECLERNSKREGKEKVPEHAIKNMYKKFSPISSETDKNFKVIIDF